MLQGRYQIEQEIGSGAHGRVYRGSDIQTGTRVAIKHLRPGLIAAEPEILSRFRREAEALKRLNHPNIVQALAAFAEGDEHYIVMEHLAGGSLRNLLDETSLLPLERTLRLALDLSDALTRAHRLNIIHRDLKPANVLLADDGTPRLSDFGVALMRDQERVTDSHSIVGTLNYISPEALNDEPLTEGADIWSFGVMMFEMLAGRHTFASESATALIAAILTQPPADLEALRPDAPAALVDLVYRMLDKNPRTRIASVRRIGVELEALLHQLKTGVEVPLLREGANTQPPATAQIDVAPPLKNNLPAQTTPFVGRDWEMNELLQMLHPVEAARLSRPRLVTILGPGGMGKSRLSLEVASQLLNRSKPRPYPDGVYFVALAPLPSEDRIPSAIADAVGCAIQGDGDPLQQIEIFLAERQILLILDNFEHLTAGASMLPRLLNACPGLTLLVTSRERLNLTAEHLFGLEGLETPPETAAVSPLEYSAIRLFVQTAQRVSPKFKLASADVAHVSEICRLVQGLPLGLVLAATWAEMLTPQEIAAELTRSAEFLEAPMHDLPERHQSMRAVFEYSWQRLSQTEQHTLARLSLFRGPFSRAAAQAVTRSSLRDLMQLVNKSLLHRDSETGYYGLHELIRQFAEAHLKNTAADYDAAWDALSHYYCFWLQDLRTAARGPQMQAVIPMDAEIDNIRQAWKRAIAQRDIAALEAAEETLYVYYRIRSLEGERMPMFNEAIAALETLPASTERDRALGRLYARQGELYMRLIELKSAQEALERSIALLRGAGDEEGLIFALEHLAQLISRRERNSDMIDTLSDEALMLAEKNQVRPYQAMIYVWRAFRANRIYRLQAGLEWAAKGLTLCREVQNTEGTGDCLRVTAMMYHQLGEAQKAIEKFAEAAPYYKTIQDWSGIIVCAVGESTAYAFLGDYASATRVLRDLETLMDEHGLNIRKTQVYALLGVIAFLEGDYGQSLSLLQEARHHSDYVGIGVFGTLYPMAYQARTLITVQRYDEADELLKQVGNTLPVGGGFHLFPMRVRGHWYAAQGRFAEAEAQYMATIKTMFGDSGDLAGLPYVVLGLADVWQHSDTHAAVLAAMLVVRSPLTWASDRDSAQSILDGLRPAFSADDWHALEHKAAETTLTVYAESLLTLKNIL